RTLDTRRPGRTIGGLAAALLAGYRANADVDVMVLELGGRSPGDMQAHLEVVRPDIAVVAPLAPSFSEDADALSTLRREILALCRQGIPANLLMCTDDPFLAELARQTPGAVGFTRDDIVARDGTLSLSIDGTTWAVGRDVAGGSQLRALSVAARAARLLGMSDGDIGAYLAG